MAVFVYLRDIPRGQQAFPNRTLVKAKHAEMPGVQLAYLARGGVGVPPRHRVKHPIGDEGCGHEP
ncbi:MAG: hypothetical protein JOZ58_07070, partial [Acetobacteraceae bacterium]|nr:hypothetical protein [Acetobacteraceae bacterium]